MDLKIKNWIDKGKASINNKEEMKIRSQEDNKVEVVFIDQTAERPFIKEFIEIVDGKEIVRATEEYEILNTAQEDVFKTSGKSGKEIPAPVTQESTSKK